MAAVDYKMARENELFLNNNEISIINRQFIDLDQPKVNIAGSEFVNSLCADCNGYKMAENGRRSEIQEFFRGKNVLITGATGFLGKILVEKLLRRCPVEALYLLVRQKRGKDVYTRVEEIFDDPVFEVLKQEVPKFRHKVVVVRADCEAAGLGLSLDDRQMLIEKINVIFHSAATVKFDEHLRAALKTNVRAPLHLLQLAKDMKGLNALIHISTAYSNPHLPYMEERFYECSTSCDQLSERIDKLSDERVENMLPEIMGPWPNTYTFTKALAEKELVENVGDVPLGVFRPAVVTSTAKEPLRCWIDNMYGPTGVTVGTATGMLRTLHCAEHVTANIVPVDYVVNCLLAAAKSVHRSYKDSKPIDTPIFNYVSSVENRITWGDFMSYNLAGVDKYPLSSAIWYVSLTLTQYNIVYKMCTFFMHHIPAAFADGLIVLVGRKPKMIKVYRKIHKFSTVISYFCTRDIRFCNKRTRELWDSTSDYDKQLFPFSMAEIGWGEYFEEYVAGIRRYLFKEKDDTLQQARVKWRRLYYLHQIVRLLFCCLAFYVLWSIFKVIF